MSAFLRTHLRGVGRAALRVLLVAWLVFATIVIVLRYVVLPNVAQYRGDVERLATRAIGETVTIGSMDASWHGLRPALALRDVRVVGPDGAAALAVAAIDAALSWETLAVFQLRLASLDIDRPSLQVRREVDGRIVVAGYPLQQKTPPDRRGAEWLLAQNAIHVRGAIITWHDETVVDGAAGPRPDLALTDVAFTIERTGWRHRLALRATPPAVLAAPVDVRAVVDHRFLATHLADPEGWRGTVYADVGSGDVAAWKTWVPLPATVDGGRGRARVWMTFDRADAPAGVFAHRLAERIKRPIPPQLDRIASVTADLALDAVTVKWGAMSDAPEYTTVGSIDGRLVGSQTMSDQHVAGIRMALQPSTGAKVPPTDFDVHRRIGREVDDESGTASIGAIDIAVSLGLVPAPLVPAPIAEKLAALRPRGILERVAVRWTGPVATPTTFECDARFAQLALAPQQPTPEAIAAAAREVVGPNGLVRKARPPFGQPGFTGVGGTLKAVRTKGPADAVAVTHATLDLGGGDVTVVAPGLFDEPTLRFAHFAGKVDIEASGSDVTVKVDRASVDNADLAADVALTFKRGPKSGGTIDKDGKPGRGWLDVDAHVARADVARVARYLPNVIGERARVYLQRSLVSGKVVDATVRVRGAVEHLSPRDQPDALATANPVTVQNALVAVRDRAGGAAQGTESRPPADAESVLHALIKVRGATFLYGPGRRPNDPLPASGVPPPATAFIPWPAFEDVDADIVFDHAKMTVHARTARVYDYRLTDITAELPALADPAHVLRVVGRGTGSMQDLVRFVNNSPISRWLRRFTDATQATGNAALALALDLPLTHPRDAELAASLQFENNDVTLNRIVPPLMHVVGRMDFSDRGLAIDNLKAEALGGPLRIDATTRKDGYIELKANGTVDVAGLQQQMRDSAMEGVETPVALNVDRAAKFISGSTHYDVDLRVRSKRVADLSENGLPLEPSSPSQPDLVVRSDLQGLAIALPEPFTKPADASWPLRVELARSVSPAATGGPSVPDVEDIHIALADRVDVRLARKRTAEGPFVATRAGYRIGAGAASGSGPSELQVELPALDVDAWRDALKDALPARAPAADRPPPSTALDALLPARATVAIGTLKAFDRTFDHLAVHAERLPAGWQADVTADQVAGRLSYTDVSGRTDTRTGVAATSTAKLVARLSRLSIPQSESGTPRVGKSLDASRQRDFPAIDVVVDRFDLRGRTLGRLEVVAENVDGADGGREWHLDRVGLTTPEARFVGHGVWGHGGGAGDAIEHTRLDFDLEASDVGALLDRFGMTRTINSGTAQLTGRASWNGGPATIDYESMSGTLKLAADKGQFLKAEPGVAKLLNILSLQGLARRLTLDFSDVFSPGFAFDTVRADATVERGIASTNDFTMRGVEAVVRMSGSADLAHETTDLRVVVEPQINAGAASLGVAVLNPVVGLATFAAQYLFKDRISQALSFEYNVVGPWSKPAVTKIDRNGKATPVVPKKKSTAEAASPAQAQKEHIE